MPTALHASNLRNLLRLRSPRAMIASYSELLVGVAGRLVLQLVYFSCLASSLSLSDFGLFAAAVSSGLLLGAFPTAGHSLLAFRAAAGRKRSLAAYLGNYYAAVALSVPFVLAASGLVYWLFFVGKIELLAFTLFILADGVAWRIFEGLGQIAAGEGRYRHASLILLLGSGAKALAAIVFRLSGEHDLNLWSILYAGCIGAALAIVVFRLRPRSRARWSLRLLIGRSAEAGILSTNNFAMIALNELERLFLLHVINAASLGLYSIAMRLLDVATSPVVPAVALLTRKLLSVRVRVTARISIVAEVGIAGLTGAGFAAVALALVLFSDALGPNFTAVQPLFLQLPLVAVAQCGVMYHRELCFVQRMYSRQLLISCILILMRIGGLLLIAMEQADSAHWGWPLSALFSALYATSALLTYPALKSSGAGDPAAHDTNALTPTEGTR